jgi:FkbH-like protein
MHYSARANLNIDFDEDWYLRQNRDVAQAVNEGGFRSGLQHFLAHGLAEGRSPLPQNGAAKATIAAQPPGSPHNGQFYLVPSDLVRSHLTLHRAAFIGSCFLKEWGFHESNPAGCPVDFFLVNNAAELPARSRDEILQYDFQVIQIPLRSVISDATVSRLSYADYAAYEAAFETVCNRLETQLGLWMRYNTDYALLTFVANFLIPQENLIGRLLPRYDLRNPAYFVEKLNEFLEAMVLGYKNAYILDTDKIAASLGRRYVQDDAIQITTHGALFPLAAPISDRLDRLAAMSSYYDIRWPHEFRDAVWAEIVAMLRTVHQLDMVKLVAVDLDDTLWAGISGDMPEVSPYMVEGWPLGLIEALLYLKKRGVLLAIISKNDESRIRRIWDEIFAGRLSLDDFAAVKINWRPKSDNMREIIGIVKVMPGSVVFIDDNPVERAEMRHAFPEMRVLGQNPYFLRRILLWAPEMQVASISDESRRRTEMMQAQFAREEQRQVVSRAEFLAAAAPKVKMTRIAEIAHPRFDRVLELLNKTNQFNTTGRRWRIEECNELLRGGGTIWAFEVSDSFTNYGLVGAVFVRDRIIEQWVMSCRVLGYQVEEAVMAHIVGSLADGGSDEVKGRLVETDANFPCRDLFAKCGFEERGNHWVLAPGTIVETPTHVRMLEG